MKRSNEHEQHDHAPQAAFKDMPAVVGRAIPFIPTAHHPWHQAAEDHERQQQQAVCPAPAPPRAVTPGTKTISVAFKYPGSRDPPKKERTASERRERQEQRIPAGSPRREAACEKGCVG